MQINQLMFTVLASAVALSTTIACGFVPPDSRSYTVKPDGDWATAENGPITESRGSVLVGDQRVEVTVRSDARKGPGFVETESFNLRGQRVVVEHDMLGKVMKVTVNESDSLQIAKTEGGLYHYRRNSYKDDASETRDLAREIAGDLIDRETKDESFLAHQAVALALTNEQSKLSRSHGLGSGKLFLALAFVDVFAQVQNQMGLAIGNDITQDFNNW